MLTGAFASGAAGFATWMLAANRELPELGELIVCPYCLGLWAAAFFAAGFAVAPRPTRWIASVLTAHFGSDALHSAYKKAENSM